MLYLLRMSRQELLNTRVTGESLRLKELRIRHLEQENNLQTTHLSIVRKYLFEFRCQSTLKVVMYT
jgi:hypothetical protein